MLPPDDKLNYVDENGVCSLPAKRRKWEKTPVQNGMASIVRVAREEGLTVNPPSRVTYTPLIHMKPSDPDTMLTAMIEAERLTQQVGQEIVVFTSDQQLYRVAEP